MYFLSNKAILTWYHKRHMQILLAFLFYLFIIMLYRNQGVNFILIGAPLHSVVN